MAFTATAFNIMIASPSDVIREHQIVQELVHEWNVLHAERQGCVLLPTHWESHTAPEIGDRPQEIINRQVLDNADLLIPVVLGSVDSDQYAALMSFKKEYESKGLIRTFDSPEEFEKIVRRDLNKSVMDHLCTQKSATPEVISVIATTTTRDTASLPRDAATLLLEATLDQQGTIMTIRTLGGLRIQTNGRQFGELGDPRSEARWEEAISHLQLRGLLNLVSGSAYRVTAEGYRTADALRGQRTS
jgi:hypothetical protein